MHVQINSRAETAFSAESRPRAQSFQTEHGAFHQVATVCGIWALTLCVGIHTMAAMRSVLVPFFWAFFLMMGLVPATDWIESAIMHAVTLCSCRTRSSIIRVSTKEEGFRESESIEEHPPDLCRTVVRTISVVLVAVTFFGLVSLFFVMIYVSALHMQQSWSHYEDGAKNVSAMAQQTVKRFSKFLPPGVIDDMTHKALAGVEKLLSLFLSLILENVTYTLAEGLMMLLYMLFWLCQPMHIGKSTADLFRQYIILKSLASGGYAFCVWLLLHFNNIDLAIVFGLITFLFNFVPEVGPFMAMVLPLPVVVFDGRITNPFITLAIVLGGNLMLKCVWANILEVKMVESQEEMKMHPVVILFFVAFFGWIWGATGMLLSVPLVAVVKASMHIVPEAYRNPIITLLEGDRKAPERYTEHMRVRHRAQTMG